MHRGNQSTLTARDKLSLVSIIRRLRDRARTERARLFLKHFILTPQTTLLDLGSGDGSHIAHVVSKTKIQPKNVFIADIDWGAIRAGQQRFKFTAVQIPEHGPLPFDDKSFDVVFCSSVIEHVAPSKQEAWNLTSGWKFRTHAMKAQRQFAAEISRIGKGYFVQTPSRWFPIESHSWLPLLGWLPREVLVPTLALTNQFWIKKTIPDWYLLTRRDMRSLFPDAQMLSERFMGLSKSFIAIKPLDPRA
ncbi:MAG TPA: class I SAM-dependent methyltransferase [Gammaproteobacteria bacterium]|nr:class I SAM-dependent methyltransferase [Gammaproteobacteria bacterium]